MLKVKIIFCLLFCVAQAQAQWMQVGGQATDIGVGADNNVWCVGWDNVPGGHSIHRWNGAYWEQKHGGAVRIDVDPNGNAWCVNNEGLIFYWNGNDWVNVGGQARDVGIGANGTVWVIGWDAVPGGFSIHRWNGSYWEKKHGGAIRIDVDANGNAWCVNDKGLIFYWNGNDWVNVGGQARDIGIGSSGQVWIVGWTVVGQNYTVHRWTGSYWANETGGLVNISASRGYIWGINSAGEIFRRVTVADAVLLSGDVVSLRCLGTTDGPRWLDGRTKDGTVGLAPNTDGIYTGTKWQLVGTTDHKGMPAFALKCLGANSGNVWLDGITANTKLPGNLPTVRLAPETSARYTGTRWFLYQDAPNVVRLQCAGHVDGNRWLDGRTKDGTVGLVPVTTGIYTGTKWEVTRRQ